MMNKVTLLLYLGLASIAAGDLGFLDAAPRDRNLVGSLPIGGPHHHPKPHGPLGHLPRPLPHVERHVHAPAHYNYEYLVNDPLSGAHFGHAESRQGYLTEGEYFVHLPDGRIQRVTYYADETGYHATVTYEGKAIFHPVPQPHNLHPLPRQAYGAPLPVPKPVGLTPGAVRPLPQLRPFAPQEVPYF